MMTGIGNKLRYYRQLRGLSQADFATRLANIDKVNISLWENGRKAVPVKYYRRICELLELRDEELFAPPGTGITNVAAISPGDLKPVPVISFATAQDCNTLLQPICEYAEEHAEDRVYFKSARPGDFAVIIRGNSMSPWYPDGTMVLVAKGEIPRHGKRVVAKLLNGDVVFKIFLDCGSKIILKSINDHEGIDLEFEKTAQFAAWIWPVRESIRNEDDLDLEMTAHNIPHRWQEKQ